MHDRDPEQEVLGFAVPVVDAVLAEGRSALPEGDPLIAAIGDVMSAESIGAGEPVRAMEVLLVLEQLEARLGYLRSQEMGPLTG
jgi:hypothetical protein